MTGKRLEIPEFTAMMAMLFATIAFSIDAMLPALPEIARELTPADVNRAQLVLSAFVFGMGAGTLAAGPLSDSFGRKPVIAAGFALYLAGSLLAYLAPSLDWLLGARLIQGLGVAGPRIVGLALVRDLYSGREMARVTSFVMTVFMIVPALAPSIGALIIHAAGWRGVFLAFVLFGTLALSWVGLRQQETLAYDRRRPLSVASLWSAAREVLTSREVMTYAAVMTLGFGQMFALLSSAQQIFGQTFGRAEGFPLWFAAMAVLAGTAGPLNARMVTRVGMRPMVGRAYAAQAVSTLVVIAVLPLLRGDAAFGLFFLWATSVFFMAGITFGNLNALSLQRMGHIAGMAASIVSAISTMLAVVIAAPVGLAFDGTPLPAMIGVLACSALAYLLMRTTRVFAQA